MLQYGNVADPSGRAAKKWICGHWLPGITGSNPAEGHGCLSLVNVVCCQVEVSATGRYRNLSSPKQNRQTVPCVYQGLSCHERGETEGKSGYPKQVEIQAQFCTHSFAPPLK